MKSLLLKRFIAFGLLLLLSMNVFADDAKDFPAKPNPPKLVNDFAGMMNPNQQSDMEEMLENYARSTSTRIAIVTVQSLNDHDVAEYTIELFNQWKLGDEKKNNGVLILASAGDRKMWITTGQGMEGVLPDGLVGRIVRNEMVPEFKAGNYYGGFKNATNAIIAASKGEYTNDDKQSDGGGPGAVSGLIVLVIIIVVILAIIKGGGGRGGGNYMRGSGSDFLTGAILGSLLGGGGRSSGGGFGSGGFGGGSSGGGGFGGFGGGMSGGGGAGGSW